MHDSNTYTQEGLANVIRYIRLMRKFFDFKFAQEEERMMILYDAAKEFGTAVDSYGKRVAPDKTRKQYPLIKVPTHLFPALKHGSMVPTEGIGF